MPATSRLLNGLDLSLATNWNTAPLMGSVPLFAIQMAILAAGLLFTLSVLHRLLRSSRLPLGHLCRTITAMAFYALIVTVSSIYLLGLPMSGRHIHQTTIFRTAHPTLFLSA